MMHALQRVCLASLASMSLVGCADPAEDNELPVTIVDGKGDGLSQPTDFGILYQSTWQYGELDPQAKVRNPAWSFSLAADGDVSITTRKAPEDDADLTLTRAVVYLYKRGTSGYTRLAKSTNTSGFGELRKTLGKGDYRVIVKGVQADDAGELMLRMDCDGPGCAQGPECLFGQGSNDVSASRYGTLHATSPIVLKPTSSMNAALQAQVIAAAQVGTPSVSTIAQAFAATEDNEIHKQTVLDWTGGRMFKLYTFANGAAGALQGTNTGAVFQDDSHLPAATLVDDVFGACVAYAQTCVFGRHSGEVEHMPFMTKLSDVTYKAANLVPADIQPYIIAATTFDGQVLSLADVFSNVDDQEVYVETYRHALGREFVAVHFYAGDTSMGMFFRQGDTASVGVLSDGDVDDCKAFDLEY